MASSPCVPTKGHHNLLYSSIWGQDSKGPKAQAQPEVPNPLLNHVLGPKALESPVYKGRFTVLVSGQEFPAGALDVPASTCRGCVCLGGRRAEFMHRCSHSAVQQAAPPGAGQPGNRVRYKISKFTRSLGDP